MYKCSYGDPQDTVCSNLTGAKWGNIYMQSWKQFALLVITKMTL